ncbi:putative ABC transporter (Substrate-binding protein) [Candidatus Terasakiella magnetica]|uniref:Putative ABC transporter (Substrate-binding protein) n=1 Tax=Candidatus Terasakiella magnetica TaxID=1867952 RepID=A0A1C3RL41_9PROT|nr:ABC transporter substrate-binding protein [Candidatus Terasakiella magnetica]SCA57973.1 putative ABC transporter (Substrate-binding protein) [Candidatus Terasakiella magnetica]
MKFLGSLFLAFVVMALQSLHAELPTLRAGVLKFGTVNWELQTIKSYGLDKAQGFNLEIVPFAGKQASATAIHGGAVDVIVNDWIWVSRQRSAGRNYSFIPYSRMVGAMMADPAKNIKTLADLKGKKLGIAGGPVDKSWLLFQALAKKNHNIDLAKEAQPVFGAPPLLSKKLETGELDGVINFWHYAAKLEAKGFNRVADVSRALQSLGMNRDVPMIGYVFSPEFAQKQDLISAMSAASRQAKTILANDPSAWAALKPMMKAKSEASFQALKEGFIKGIPQSWGDKERLEAANLFALLAKLGGKKLVGKSSTIAQGTFVEAIRY